MLLLGPNCLGLLDTHAGLNATGGDQPAGGVSLVSQMGNLALEVGLLLTAERQGFTEVRLGRQPGRPDDPRHACGHWSATSRRGSWRATWRARRTGFGFVAAVRALAEEGKPPLVIKAGRTDVRGTRCALPTPARSQGSAQVFAATLR